ncbi:hypothetical protein TNCV_2830211 [Trichonephila clavipes]|nr:hypothetical protein TNCV_2830211 [Trichonephila clavipes]
MLRKDLPALAVETKEKRNRLNRRPELYRGKYRCVQPKINLLKRRPCACETMFSCGTFRMSKRCLHMMEKLSSSENYDMFNLCIFVV